MFEPVTPTSPPAKAASANSPADAVPSFEAMHEVVSQPTWYDRMFAEDAAWAQWLVDNGGWLLAAVFVPAVIWGAIPYIERMF